MCRSHRFFLCRAAEELLRIGIPLLHLQVAVVVAARPEVVAVAEVHHLPAAETVVAARPEVVAVVGLPLPAAAVEVPPAVAAELRLL